jgi:hypothetical protein
MGFMKEDGWIYVAVAVLAGGWLLTPTHTQARGEIRLSINGDAESCAELKVHSSGEIARAASSFTLTKAQAPALEVNGGERGIIRVRGWNRPDYAVEACRIAAADTRAQADQLLGSIKVSQAGGRFSSSGPANSNSQWEVVFIVHAPSGAALDLETRNGPIDVRSVTGSLKVRATNGPVSVSEGSGAVDAHAANGPISFSGSGGDVRLVSSNGPVSVQILGDSWSGQQLEARTTNGPVSVQLPANFRSGLRLETDGHSPVSCSLATCRGARMDTTGAHRVMELNGSSPLVRVSTTNGPVSVRPTGRERRVI